jgi:hypothetical protein
VAVLWLAPAVAGAQAATPATPAPASPIAIADPFVIPWKHDALLACMTFSNTSDRAIQAVRFGLSTVEDNPLGSEPTAAYVDRVGAFAPGVAIRPPTRFLGTVNSNSTALDNCWTMDPSPVNVKSTLQITVLKVVFADGTIWMNPTPSQAMATVTY